ncbi:MAG: porin family protein [Chitinophagaceae bacterium]|nr:porin family protein [Chitinophagaceae bacterium]MCA6457889.1 porin family protein [Chitinophagaceae bacterium]MCA6463602.1 porin family protein [Chitinophagaceae bacterium]
MKQVIFSALLLLSIVTVSQAQGIRAGVKAGANLNKISGQSFSDGFDLSYHFGGFLELDLNKKWGLQPEILWSQSTSKPSSFKTIYATSVNPLLDGNQQIKLDYLTIPLLLRYNVGGILTLNAGPQFGILLKKDNTLLQNGQSAFKDGDFALVAGAQLNFKYLRIYGRYNIGLQNINDIDNKDKWTNQQIQGGIGLRF